MKTDYVYGVPVFKFSKSLLGDEVDVFISGGHHDLDNEDLPFVFRASTYDTINEYYDALDELKEWKRKNKSWAV